MSSEIRANTLKNRVGLGTVSYTDTGIIVSGIVTANSFEGDGSSLTGIDATALKDPAGNVKIQAQASGAVHTGISTFGNIHLNSGAKVGFTTDSNTYFEQDGFDRLSFTIGGTKTVAMIENGSTYPVLLVDSNGTNTSMSQQGAGYNSNANANDIVIGNVSSGNHGLTICSSSSGYGNIQFSDGSGGGLDATRGSIVFTHSDNKLNLKSKIGSIALTHKDVEKLSTTDTGVSITGNLSATGNLTPGGTLYLTDAIEHTDDSNTKIRFPAADTISFTTNSSERVKIFSNGGTAISNAGSFPTSTNETLTVRGEGHNGHGTTNTRSVFNITAALTSRPVNGGGGLWVGARTNEDTAVIGTRTANGNLAIETHNSGWGERLRIDSTGRVMIGTTTEGQATADDLTIATSGTTGITIRSGTSNDGNIYFSDGTSGSDEFRGYVQYGHSADDMVFGTNAKERLRIRGDGEIRINHTQSSTPLNNTFISIWDANSDSSAIDASGVSKNYAMISLHNYGTGVPGDTTGIAFGAGTGFSYTKGSIAFQRTGSYGLGDLVFLTNNDSDTTMVNDGDERMRITKEGDIYGPGGGRKNWFDNGSFDCRGGRRANASMDYGNHHAYGWVTDRFQSRNSVQWSRSTNVPTGKGFSYSTQTNSGSGSLCQAVELPDYGDMGVFTPNSYWCVSVWSTTTIINSASAFSYDLGSTKTNASVVHPTGTNHYASTGETASGTSTGTFTRYYMVFQMPSSIISGATALYFTWFLQNAGYATGWQLERVPTSTSKPTPYEHVHPAVTTARCRRYCFQNVNSRLFNGYKRHDSNIHWSEIFPVPPTHMPSGSNQGAIPYGIHLHDGGLLTNFQGILQNPGVNSVTLSEFDHRSGRVIIVGSTSYSPTHVTVPSWESQEYEIGHGFF